MNDMDNMLTLFNLGIGIFFLISGITRKGSLYKNDYPDEIKPEVNKVISILAIVVGILMTAISVIEMYAIDNLMVLSYIMYGICLVLVLGTVIYFKKKFGKYLK